MPHEIETLIKGYHTFRKQYFSSGNTLYDTLTRNGQRPKALMIACSDSRVDPAIMLNSQPGDLFVVRNVANLVPPYEPDGAYHGTSAALEFAVRDLGIRHIIVCGHAQCGGVTALLQNPHSSSEHSFIHTWMRLAEPARQHVLQHHRDEPLERQVTLCSQYAVIQALKHLETFPWIAERLAQGKMFLHGWYFDLAQGLLYAYKKTSGQFEVMEG